MSNAARVGDMHSCPSGTGPGASPTAAPILPPGAPTVLIGGKAAARAGDLCSCPPSGPAAIVKGSSSVLIGGKPAARIGDALQGGGTILTTSLDLKSQSILTVNASSTLQLKGGAKIEQTAALITLN